MLKKDLKDKVGLNIVLCIFMIIAATLLVTSAGFIYTFLLGQRRLTRNVIPLMLYSRFKRAYPMKKDREKRSRISWINIRR